MQHQANIQLIPAGEADYPVVKNLSGYYIYDFTEFFDWPCPESGAFAGCDGMFAAWQGGYNDPYLIPLAKAHGLHRLWITTNPDNFASRRTCERLGARLVQVVPLPEDHHLYASGEREKCRYRLELGEES